jgi:hypothetical protein
VFCAKNKSYVEKAEFKAVMEDIRNFLALPVRTVQEGRSFTKTWKPGGPWRETVINVLRSRSSQDSERCDLLDLVSCSLLLSVGALLRATFRKMY